MMTNNNMKVKRTKNKMKAQWVTKKDNINIKSKVLGITWRVKHQEQHKDLKIKSNMKVKRIKSTWKHEGKNNTKVKRTWRVTWRLKG